MEIVQAIGTSILSAIVEDLVKSTGRHVSYIFRFKSIIEDLNEETGNLRLTLEHMQHGVERAIRNTEEIEEDVQKWLKDVGDVVADVENLKKDSTEKQTCLNGWCPNWMWKYQLAKKAEKKKNIVLKLKESGNFGNISQRATLPFVISPEDFTPFESNQRSFDQVIEALKDDKINVVGLYGMGGVGKTTLAKAVAKKTKEDNVFNTVIMVVVSQTPNIKSIQGQLSDFLDLKLDEETIEGRAARLSKRLKDEKKILIILDDIWAKLDLKIIGIYVKERHEGCKIFLTTRRQQVCIDMGCQKRIPLDVLNEKEGLLLLKRQVGLNDDSPTLIQLAKEVANECKGLPLAIVTVGSALKEKTTDEWKTMIQKLKNSKLMEVDSVDQDVYACLKWSYDYLKNENTKFCFLLCSLFPEDYEIDMEELLRYGLGLGWYQDTNLIEDARTELRVMVNYLKASSLLLDAGEGFVKMHDVVRDVALWITSKGEYVFMAKASMGLNEWPKKEGLEQCTAISLIGSKIEVFPDDLVCPKLLILLLGSYYFDGSEICEKFFEEMKALKVVTLVRRELSLKSLQSLTNLVTLQLIECELRDLSSVKKLAKLEVLGLQYSVFDESLEELKELKNLRILDLRDYCLEMIPANVIPRLARLEQLHIISNSSEAQKAEETNAEGSNASLFELNKLNRLTTLSLRIIAPERLPKGFVLLKKLLKYDIRVNYKDSRESYPKSRSLTITDIKGTSLLAFKALYVNVEYLQLVKIMGCYQNIIPSIDETGLIELKRLSLKDLHEVECIIDMSQRHVSNALSNLETLEVKYCDRMSCLFPTFLSQRLRKLKEVAVYRCSSLQDVFQLQGLCYTKENPFVLSSLARLHLFDLPNLINIWKSPTQQVRLQSLTDVRVSICNKLRYVFTLNLARSLLQLQLLNVQHCDGLEHIVEIKAEETGDNVATEGGNDVLLPELRGLVDMSQRHVSNALSNLETLEVKYCDRMSCLFPTFLNQRLRKLKEVVVGGCSSLQDVFQLEGLCYTKENPFVLSSLARLDLFDLPNLSNIWKSPTQQVRLQSLTDVRVYWCNKLRYVFTLNLARSLLQLQHLIVENCNGLEHIVEMKAEEIGDNVATEGGTDVVFPKLRKLELQGVKKLINFCSENYNSTWPALREIIIRRTPSLVAELGANMQTAKETLQFLRIHGASGEFCKAAVVQLKNNFQNLKMLEIQNCRGVEVIFDLHQQFSLKSLKELGLWGLKDLECLYKGPPHLLSLPNLQRLLVDFCPKLRHLLSSTLAGNLLQLKTIQISDSRELEQLMVEDDRKDHVQLPLFPNLSSIYVSDCHKLKTLFPDSIARRLDLQQLTYLEVSYSPQLQGIFGQKDETDMTTGGTELQLVLPQLQYLNLRSLESLIKFCPSGYHLIFPSLEYLEVHQCPKITTRFSVEQNGTVHAQAQKSHIDSQHVNMEHSPPETARDIRCRDLNEIREKLPQYNGK